MVDRRMLLEVRRPFLACLCSGSYRLSKGCGAAEFKYINGAAFVAETGTGSLVHRTTFDLADDVITFAITHLMN